MTSDCWIVMHCFFEGDDGIPWDRLTPGDKTVPGVIGMAIREGDDPEWIEESLHKSSQ